MAERGLNGPHHLEAVVALAGAVAMAPFHMSVNNQR